MTARTMTLKEWEADGERLFGTERLEWRFECPMCGAVFSVSDYGKTSGNAAAIGTQCIGNFRPGGCNFKDGTGDEFAPLTVVFGVNNIRIMDFDRSADHVKVWAENRPAEEKPDAAGVQSQHKPHPPTGVNPVKTKSDIVLPAGTEIDKNEDGTGAAVVLPGVNMTFTAEALADHAEDSADASAENDESGAPATEDGMQADA